ncbi:MAG: VOC family protein [Jatrophihabitans sp.]
MPEYPQLLQTVLDTENARELAEFYRELLGLRYRDGDQPSGTHGDEDSDWLVLVDSGGGRTLAFQQVTKLTRPTWPTAEVPMQLHIDMTVPSVEQLRRQRRRAEELGALLLLDRTSDPDEPLYVLADPAGHPFCIFVA